MRKAPEELGTMEVGPSFTKPRGIVVSRACAVFLTTVILISFVGVVFLMYSLSPCTCSNSTTRNRLASSKKLPLDVRLPTSVRPESYNLELIPFLEEGNFTFNGQVVINVRVTSPTDNITLHSSDLTIEKVHLFKLDNETANTSVEIISIKFDKKRDFLVLFTSDFLTLGLYQIDIKYKGILNDALQGFYRSSYSLNNVTRWIATTQFQSTDARKAFPCFDEPAMKAKFKISIARPKNMRAVSNMPLVGPPQPSEEIADYEWDNFKESVPMSTYLVAFTVSDFEHLSNGNFAVWARNGTIEQAKYALEIGPKILKHFEDFFQIPFPLPKMDMMAIPDLAAGAMENWGLITYRESTMLYQEGVSARKHKQRVGTVVAHELAHQWFGNLVTPAWWSDLWLNEGFATYIECLGVDIVEPTWRTSDQFVIQDLQNVLLLDTYLSSHPVSSSVSHPNEIDEIFDSISYGKGASIIRMMNHFLTTPVFQKGLTNYLKSRSYQSATQDDLWSALTAQAYTQGVLDQNTTVKEIMDSWTLKTGYPLVTVERNYVKGSAIVSQKRLIFGNMSSVPESDWWVPLSYTTQSQLDFNTTSPSHWLQAEPAIIIDNVNESSNKWILFNIQQTGFFRVNYDIKNWKMIAEYLLNEETYQKIGDINRAQILDDSLHLARAGVLDYELALNITRYLKHELAYLPWASAFPCLGYIDSMINKMPVYYNFKKYMLNLIDRLFKETGFIDRISDPQLTVYKRVDVLKWACYLGNPDCVRKAVDQYQNWRSSPQPDKDNPISPNLKTTIYCTAINVGGQNEWEFAWERYLRTNVGSEKSLLLSALGCTREVWILSRYLHWSVTEGSGIRKQDASAVFGAVASNPIGQPLAFAFLRDNWKHIKHYFGPTAFTIDNIVRVTTSDMNTAFELEMLKDFANDHFDELGSATQVAQQSIEHVAGNVAWMKSNYQHVERWLLSEK